MSVPESKVISTSSTMRSVHWVIAAGVFFLFASSWWMLSLPLPSNVFTYRELPFQLHKNIGITLFILSIILLIAQSRKIAKARSMGIEFSVLRQLSHWAFHGVILACCITGYVSSSYSGWGTELWWIIQLPSWAVENDEMNELFSDFHLINCWLLVLFIVVHIAAAIHHVLNGDSAIDSMFGSHLEVGQKE